MKLQHAPHHIIGLGLLVLLTGCGDDSKDVAQANKADTKTSLWGPGLNPAMFTEGAFVDPPEIVDCETTAGTQTDCYLLKTAGEPTGRSPGPFCPRNLDDGPEDVGAWFAADSEGDLVDLTGQFIAGLANYYNDPNWQLFDEETGKVRYTATKEACFGAAKPNVEEQYKQNCIECEMAYLEEGFTRTYLIPVKPIPSESTERVRTVGVAIDGAELAGPAPVDAILGSYTIAAFDDCGGHINEHQGYHYHSTTGCIGVQKSDDGYALLIGYAPDGYAIYAMRDAQGNEADALDECRGTTDDIRGYHYRAASPSENMMIGCLRGETVSQPGDHGPGPGAGAPPPPFGDE